MPVELDHIFVCTAPGAPEAETLVHFGLRESLPNQHPGQGTACRRFAFLNAMIELLWVSNSEEAQNERTRRTLLWERWSARDRGGAPFGICLRPGGTEDCTLPFPGWEYRPAYLEEPLFLYIGEAGIEEPMWAYLSFLKRQHREQWFVEHPLGVREITGLTLTTPVPLRSPAAQKITQSGVLSARKGTEFLLALEFDHGERKQRFDLRPHLPLMLEL